MTSDCSDASSCQPEPAGAKGPRRVASARGSYLALLPVGLAMPALLPARRWALTPPFHPYPSTLGRSIFCGAFRRIAPPGRYPAPFPCGVRTFLGTSCTQNPKGRRFDGPSDPLKTRHRAILGAIRAAIIRPSARVLATRSGGPCASPNRHAAHVFVQTP